MEKLDYIKDLGVESIWLSPIYEGGGVDYGNDITDHQKIDPMFGTNDDFQDLLKKVADKGKIFTSSFTYIPCCFKYVKYYVKLTRLSSL